MFRVIEIVARDRLQIVIFVVQGDGEAWDGCVAQEHELAGLRWAGHAKTVNEMLDKKF